MKLTCAVILSTSFALVGCTSNSTSYSPRMTGQWLGKEQALAKDRAMLASDMVPISIDCMMDTTANNPRPTYFVKIEYKPRADFKKWRWGVGEADEMQVHSNTAKREGLKHAQTRQMLDPNSGKQAFCSLWHG